jgi:hypothetical protein
MPIYFSWSITALLSVSVVRTITTYRKVGAFYIAWSREILLLFHLPWFASWAALEAMDQSLPPRPALFLRLMLILKPSRFRQLLSNLWVTHPHTTTPYHPKWPLDLVRHESVGADTNGARQSSIPKQIKRAFLLNSTAAVAAMPERSGVNSRNRAFTVTENLLGLLVEWQRFANSPLPLLETRCFNNCSVLVLLFGGDNLLTFGDLTVQNRPR